MVLIGEDGDVRVLIHHLHTKLLRRLRDHTNLLGGDEGMDVLGDLRRSEKLKVDGVKSQAVVEVVDLAQDERKGKHTFVDHQVEDLLYLLVHLLALVEHGVQVCGLCLEDVSALLMVSTLSVVDGQATETIKDVDCAVFKQKVDQTDGSLRLDLLVLLIYLILGATWRPSLIGRLARRLW